jgi:hypothetical protein
MKRERHLGKVILQDREGRLECAKCGDDQHANTYQVGKGVQNVLTVGARSEKPATTPVV